jgi:DNA polymerase
MTPRCSLCPHHRPPVPPSGPTPARLLFLGECPGRDEDKNGEPFCGKTGVELNQTYLLILGIPRSDIHVANAVQCSRKDYSNPTPAEALACASVHLAPLLAQVKPEVLVVMGAIACSLFDINLNLEHGLPCVKKCGAWVGVCFPMYHPSAGLHATSWMIPLQADFAALKKFLGSL